MKYKYEKRCRSCDNVFFSKPITEEQFSELEINPNIHTSFASDEWTAEITSCCSSCAEDAYAEEPNV